MPINQLVDTSLGDVSLSFRQSLNTIDDYFVRSLITLISPTADKGSISYDAQLDVSKDFLISTWAEQKNAYLDYGVWGIPDFCEEATACGVGRVVVVDAKDDGWTEYIGQWV